jgi:hypothetical protein
VRERGDVTVTIGAATGGDFTGKLSTRQYLANVHTKVKPVRVTLSSATTAGADAPLELQQHGSIYSLQYAESGWYFNKAVQGGMMMIKTTNLSTSTAHTVSLNNGPHYDHLELRPCTSASTQKFAYDDSTGTITYMSPSASAATPLCMASSVQEDPASGTPAIELMPCITPPPVNQQWTFTGQSMGEVTAMAMATGTAGNIKERKGGRCFDLDRGDRWAELYGCGKKQANQMWLINGNSTIQSALDATCITATP